MGKRGSPKNLLNQETRLCRGIKGEILVWIMKHLGRRTEANARAYLDGGVDGVADDAGVGLPGAEPDRGDLGAGVEHEVPRHRRLSQSLCYWALGHTGIGERRGA